MIRHAFAVATTALLLLAPSATPCPAIPDPVEVCQPDGMRFLVEVEGDEYFHFVREVATGYTVIQTDDGSWWYADLGADGRLVATAYRVGEVDPATTGLRPGLEPTVPDLSLPVLAAGGEPRAPRRPLGKSADFELPPSTEVIALMCQFPSTAGYNTQAYWNDLLFGPSASLAEYYDEVSYGQFAITGAVRNWQTLPLTLAAYDGDPSLWTRMIPHVVAAFDATVDFSAYDGNGDGIVDHLVLVCAGDDPSDGSGTGIWPHMSWSTAFVPTADGVEIGSFVVVDDYTFAADHRASLGTVCHEFGHNLAWPMGFADLYDPDAGSMSAADNNDYPVRHWCLMGEGSWAGPTQTARGTVPAHPSGFHRMLAGWITPTTITASGSYSLSPIEGVSGTRLYKVPVAAKPQEFFLLEFRKASAPCVYDKYSYWCTYGGSYPPLDSGLLVTKVDSTMWAKAVQNAANYGTSSYAHYSVEVVDSGFQGYGGSTCPDTVVTRNETRTSATFSSEDGTTLLTVPLSDRFDGTASGIGLSGIGSGAGSTIPFTLTRTETPVASALLLFDDSFPYAAFYTATGRMRGVRFAAPPGGTSFSIDRAYFCFASAGLPASFKLHVMNNAGTTDLITPITVSVASTQAFPMWREVDLSGYPALRNLASGTGFMIAVEQLTADVPYLWFDPFTGDGHSYEKPPAGAWALSTSGGPIDYMIRADVSASGLVPVTLTSFQARAVDGGVRLEWTVADAIDHVGFRVYRATGGSEDWSPLNEHLVEAREGQHSYFDGTIIPGYRYRYRLGEVSRTGEETPMGLVEVEVPRLLPPRITLLGARPNPTGGAARVRVATSWAGLMQIGIYDLTGRQVRTVTDGLVEGGEHTFEWDGLDDLGRPVGSGVYFVRARSGGQVESEKIALVR